MQTNEREHVGSVYVDAGMVWIGDPCYVLGDDASHGVKTWHEFCDKIDYDQYPTVQQVLGEGIGFAVSSGYGDGAYPVYVTKNNDGRVIKLEVEFDSDDYSDDDDDDHDEDYAEGNSDWDLRGTW
jgi:hypothetical protein